MIENDEFDRGEGERGGGEEKGRGLNIVIYPKFGPLSLHPEKNTFNRQQTKAFLIFRTVNSAFFTLVLLFQIVLGFTLMPFIQYI
jgi:hypothetical protein